MDGLDSYGGKHSISSLMLNYNKILARDFTINALCEDENVLISKKRDLVMRIHSDIKRSMDSVRSRLSSDAKIFEAAKKTN